MVAKIKVVPVLLGEWNNKRKAEAVPECLLIVFVLVLILACLIMNQINYNNLLNLKLKSDLIADGYIVLIIIFMDSKFVESELRNHLIREGVIYRRTKFLQEWRERWMVLTMNYIFVFTDKTHQ